MDLSLFFAILNFGLFVGLLGLLLRRPLREFWRVRSEALRVRIGKAREKRARAETTHAELASRVERLKQEMEALVVRMRQDGKLEQQRIIEEAQAFAARLDIMAKRVAQQELAKARYQLQRNAAHLTIGLAERVIRQGINEADQQRLAQDFLDQLRGDASLSGGVA